MNLPVFQGLVQQIDNKVIVVKDPEILGVEMDDAAILTIRLPHSIMPHEMHRLVGRRVLICFPGEADED